MTEDLVIAVRCVVNALNNHENESLPMWLVVLLVELRNELRAYDDWRATH